MNPKEALIAKFENRTATVAVVGLGYVGLPLAVSFAESGYGVIGIDIDAEKVDALNRGESPMEDVAPIRLRSLLTAPATVYSSYHDLRSMNGHSPQVGTARNRLWMTADFAALAACDAVSICVPTPLNKAGNPDTSYIIAVASQIRRYLHSGMVVVLESTTYPGTTAEILLPELQQNGDQLKIGEDFFLAYAPERIDPGRTNWTVETMPKVIGGITPACLEVASSYYSPAVGELVPVSSPEAAEIVKLFENTFRSVNIGLVNELLIMCDKLGLDVWEVVEAAATKPFGFMEFTPGPGLGEHYIPIDPNFLSWKLRALDYNARFIDLANEVNTEMPKYWVHKVQDALNEVCLPVQGSRILVLGAAYKKNIGDTRESPAVDMIYLLQQKGADVRYHDPYVPTLCYQDRELACITALDEEIWAADCVVIATDHDLYDWLGIEAMATQIVDTRRVLERVHQQIARTTKDGGAPNDHRLSEDLHNFHFETSPDVFGQREQA